MGRLSEKGTSQKTCPKPLFFKAFGIKAWD